RAHAVSSRARYRSTHRSKARLRNPLRFLPRIHNTAFSTRLRAAWGCHYNRAHAFDTVTIQAGVFPMRIGIVLVLAVAGFTASADARTIVHAGHLIDGVGNAPRDNMSVVIENGRIADVAAGFVPGAAGRARPA